MIYCFIVLETRGIITPDMFESLEERVREKICFASFSSCTSNLPAITCAASLAHRGLLGSVKDMGTRDVDLTSVPAEHLASLASNMTGRVFIENVRGFGLVTILDSVNCERLVLSCQSLSSEETQALVRAMESSVERVQLQAKVSLDIQGFMGYGGQGKCRRVECYSETADRYKEQLRTWTVSRNWAVTWDGFSFTIDRILPFN